MIFSNEQNSHVNQSKSIIMNTRETHKKTLFSIR